MSEPPLLSICVPTYNRAERLRLALLCLSEQICGLEEDVEVIVSDNCSQDHTREVVKEVQSRMPLLYSRNAENLGSARNFVKATCELASGEYCWIIGDDDMIRKGKVAKILGVIKANQDLDYFFMNHFYKSVEERDHTILEMGSFLEPSVEDCFCKDLTDHRMKRWEDLLVIENSCPTTQFTSMVCHIMRRPLWREGARQLSLKGDSDYTSLDFSFPHLKVAAVTMAGKPAFYIGDPCILLAVGAQEWISLMPAISFVGLDQAIDLYKKCGVDKSIVRSLRDYYYQQYAPMLFTGERRLSVEGNRYLRAFARQNWMHPLKMGMLAYYAGRKYVLGSVIPTLPRPIFMMLRAAKRTFFGISTKA